MYKNSEKEQVKDRKADTGDTIRHTWSVGSQTKTVTAIVSCIRKLGESDQFLNFKDGEKRGGFSGAAQDQCELVRKAPTSEYPEGQWIEGYGPAPIQCPNCNNTGGYPIPDGDGDWQEEQCEFCWTEPNSIFNRTR